VLVVVEQALGDVERGDVVVLGLFGEGEDEFVAGAALRVGGLAADGFEAFEQVVGGEGGVFADALDLALLLRTIFRRRRSVNGLQILTENSYSSAEGALLRW
jgi:CubicO group peptidase (beta-lactamase class C family)